MSACSSFLTRRRRQLLDREPGTRRSVNPSSRRAPVLESSSQAGAMGIIAAPGVEVPVAYDVTLDSWVIDVRPARVNAGGTIQLDVSGSSGASQAKRRTRAVGGGRQSGYAKMTPSSSSGCGVVQLRRALGSVKRRMRVHLACCAKAVDPATGHLQTRWWWSRRSRSRRRCITVGLENMKQPRPTRAAWRDSLRGSQRHRDEKLSDAINYCKATMGFTAPRD